MLLRRVEDLSLIKEALTVIEVGYKVADIKDGTTGTVERIYDKGNKIVYIVRLGNGELVKRLGQDIEVVEELSSTDNVTINPTEFEAIVERVLNPKFLTKELKDEGYKFTQADIRLLILDGQIIAKYIEDELFNNIL